MHGRIYHQANKHLGLKANIGEVPANLEMQKHSSHCSDINLTGHEVGLL